MNAKKARNQETPKTIKPSHLTHNIRGNAVMIHEYNHTQKETKTEKKYKKE